MGAHPSDGGSLFVVEVPRQVSPPAKRRTLVAKFLSVLGLILVGVLGLVGAVTFSLRFTGTTLSDLAPTNAPKLENPITSKPKLERIVGKAKVLDGDTIEISGRRIRLFGIDAPENGQIPVRCDRRAVDRLRHMVECEPKDLDIYSHIVSVCFVQGEDISAWMVAKGWALAYRQYSRDYVSQEERASKAKLGLWQGEFELPWDWRQRVSQSNAHLQSGDKQPNNTPSKDCVIKGNINDRGRHIYHMPGDKFYSRITISVAKGERWFCSEAEAIAAGWQHSRR
jgi:endonuclease YncB( thermonuclease family)